MKKSTTFLFLFIASWSWSQESFNKYFHRDSMICRYEKIIETDLGYYAIGYADSIYRNTTGLQIVLHDKSSGEELNYNYFDIANEHINLNENIEPQFINNKLRFTGAATNLYDFEYDISNQELTIRDSIINPAGSGSYFIYDRKVYGDTIIISATTPILDSELDYYAANLYIFYPNGEKRKVDFERSDTLQTVGMIFKQLNGDFVTFGNVVDGFSFDSYMTMNHLDNEYNLIGQTRTEKSEGFFSVKDVLMTSDSTFLILALGQDWDPISSESAFSHTILKYNTNRKEIDWKYNYGVPFRAITNGGKIVNSHETGKHLYCTTAAKYSEELDSVFVTGRIVKIDENGLKEWHRDYYFFDNNLMRNEFNTMIRTSDWKYVIGGIATGTLPNSWLVKIDENGEIVPDNLSSTKTEFEIINEEIKIFPNPVSDYLHVNQNDINDITYQIFNLKGQKLLTMKVDDSNTSVIWNISSLLSGTYFLRIYSKDGFLGMRKIIKQ